MFLAPQIYYHYATYVKREMRDSHARKYRHQVALALLQPDNSRVRHVTVSMFRLILAQQPPPQEATASSFTRFLDHTQQHATVSRTPLDEWSARRRDLYLTTHDTHNGQTSMPPGGFRTHNLSRRAAADLRLRPRGHWDRPCYNRL